MIGEAIYVNIFSISSDNESRREHVGVLDRAVLCISHTGEEQDITTC